MSLPRSPRPATVGWLAPQRHFQDATSANTPRSVGNTTGQLAAPVGSGTRAPSEHSWGPPVDSTSSSQGPMRGGGRAPPSRNFIDPDVMPPPVPRLAGSSSAASSDGGRIRRNSAGSCASLVLRSEQASTPAFPQVTGSVWDTPDAMFHEAPTPAFSQATGPVRGAVDAMFHEVGMMALPHASASGRRSAENMSDQVAPRSATPTPVASTGMLSELSDRAPLAPAVNRMPDLRRSASTSSVAVLDQRRPLGVALPPSCVHPQQQREQHQQKLLQRSVLQGPGSHRALNCNLCSASQADAQHCGRHSSRPGSPIMSGGAAGEIQIQRDLFPLEQVSSHHANTALAMRAAGERAMRSGSVPASVRSACPELELQQAMRPCPSELTCKTAWDLNDASLAVYPSAGLVPASLSAAAMPWPPPPLPPIPDELRLRLEALEAQRSAHLRAEDARERQVDKLKAELATAEAQLERCGRDWGTRFAALEASQAATAEGAAEAAQWRQRDLELARDRALAEVQRAQTAGDLERERHAEAQSRHRETHLELEQVRIELLRLQAERVSDQQLREQAQHRSAELSLDAEGLQAELRRLREAQHAQEDIASDRQRAWVEVQRLQLAAAERDEAKAELGRLHQAQLGHHQVATELRSAHEEVQGLRGELTRLQDAQRWHADAAASRDMVQSDLDRCRVDLDRERTLRCEAERSLRNLQDEVEQLRREVNRLQTAVDLAETRQHGPENENRRLHAELLRLQEEARQVASRSEAHVRHLVTELETEKATGQRRHEVLAEQLQECVGGHKQSVAASAECLQEAQQQISALRGQLVSTEEDRQQVEKSLSATLTQERQAFKDLLDHNRILELEMRDMHARTKLHSDMQQSHIVHPAATLSEQQGRHTVLRETVELDDAHRPTMLFADQAEYGGSFQIRPPTEPVVRVTTQYSESPASSARSSTLTPPMAADLTDSLDPVPLTRPRRLSHQIEVDLTMETSDRNIDVEMVTPGHFFYEKTRA